MVVIQYPKCSTCKKALKWLKDNNIHYMERHIKENPPTAEELVQWQKKSGLPLKRFFNTSGLLYREQGLAEKLPTLSEAEQLTILASSGMMVKRPIVVTDETVLVGFKEKEWAATLK